MSTGPSTTNAQRPTGQNSAQSTPYATAAATNPKKNCRTVKVGSAGKRIPEPAHARGRHGPIMLAVSARASPTPRTRGRQVLHQPGNPWLPALALRHPAPVLEDAGPAPGSPAPIFQSPAPAPGSPGPGSQSPAPMPGFPE